MPATQLAQPPATTPRSRSAAPRRLMTAAAATLVIAAATPVTLAHANLSASVSPTTVAPGGQVALNIAGCGTNEARVTSAAFNDVRLPPGNLEATNLRGHATVFSNANPGDYEVIFECGGRRVQVSLQVTPGAARGGTGGSIGSMSTTQIAVGGTLAAAALVGGVWVLRRRAAA
ncbi:hypothetical protein AB0N09_23100 [Streptomyces erythrochromogenes]|uniref:hypothetical protein n=1 Tax=Streptomyces erythrochromogenes TaxID=285574 RepID=UPI0034236E6D